MHSDPESPSGHHLTFCRMNCVGAVSLCLKLRCPVSLLQGGNLYSHSGDNFALTSHCNLKSWLSARVTFMGYRRILHLTKSVGKLPRSSESVASDLFVLSSVNFLFLLVIQLLQEVETQPHPPAKRQTIAATLIWVPTHSEMWLNCLSGRDKWKYTVARSPRQLWAASE